MWKKIESWIHTHETAFWVCIIVSILRIPSLFEPYWYGDEAIYLTIGQALRKGEWLYRDIFDHKPPIIYWLSAAVDGNLFWFKLLGIVICILTIIGFYQLLKRLNISKIGVHLLVFGLLITLPTIEGNIVNAELLFLLPVVWAFFLGIKPTNSKNVLLAGILFGLATLIKVPAIFEAAALGGYWLISRQKGIFKNGVLLALGIIIPIAASFGYFYTQGLAQDYLKYAWTYNLSYTATWKSNSVFDNLWVKFIIVLAIFVFSWWKSRKLSEVARLVSVWIPISLFAAMLSNRPYPHYLIQAATGVSLATVLIWKSKREKLWGIFLGLLLMVTIWHYKFGFYPTFPYYSNFISFVTKTESKDEYFRRFDTTLIFDYKIAEIIAKDTNKYDRIFVWGDRPTIYALSRRSPIGHYTTKFHIQSLHTEDETISAIATGRVKYIVTMGEENKLPGLWEILLSKYMKVWENGDEKVYKLWKKF
ncbi:MAG: hypothetical protein UU93_C0001G0040 [Candidatus Amesbacteria bacterium GW2011_GWA2_42_12]|uniref:Glycosyltransferase RgtA/B/C/D-like domain-containing protein n=1 Tax=Candidatus Amesbacteria bacterium GW2011_GWA2_42_12 TaxID=1618356 RepID=A0A0G0Y947_9BACT|nr:MAG: hypothetical protein UU93_C0001G0040 [Candidatus Amesbacteria bacterium GW2011_GWA2_42_12]